MTSRIPPSLNWLINKRARIHGKILRINKEKSEYLAYAENRLNNLEKDLAALDRALSLHEIKISPEIIPPNRGCRKENKLEHGELSKLIIEAIWKNCDQQATAQEIRAYVAIQASLRLNKEVPEKSLMYSVKNQIKNLCRNNKLIRVPFEEKGPRRHYEVKVNDSLF